MDGGSVHEEEETEKPSRTRSVNHGVDTAVLATAAGCIIVWSLVSDRLERLFITAPIAFVIMGRVVTHGPLALSTSIHSHRVSGHWPRSPWLSFFSPMLRGSMCMNSAKTSACRFGSWPLACP